MTDDLKHTQQSIYLKGWYELAKESADEWTLCYQGWVFTVKKNKPLDVMREQIDRLTRERDELDDILTGVFNAVLCSNPIDFESVYKHHKLWENKTDEE